jgi:hypothetical protein
VFIGAEPIDLRWSFDRLAGVVTVSVITVLDGDRRDLDQVG